MEKKGTNSDFISERCRRRSSRSSDRAATSLDDTLAHRSMSISQTIVSSNVRETEPCPSLANLIVDRLHASSTPNGTPQFAIYSTNIISNLYLGFRCSLELITSSTLLVSEEVLRLTEERVGD